MLLGVKVEQVRGHAHAVIEPGKRFSMNKLHQITGHTGRHLIGPTSHYFRIKVTGKLNPCEHYARAKIRLANIPKTSQGEQSRRPGKRVFIDISSMMHPSVGGRKHWLLIVDETTNYVHSIFSNKNVIKQKI